MYPFLHAMRLCCCCDYVTRPARRCESTHAQCFRTVTSWQAAAAELAFPEGPQSHHHHLFLENTVEEEIAQREIVKEVVRSRDQDGVVIPERDHDAGAAVPAVGGSVRLRQGAGGAREGPVQRCEYLLLL